MDETDLPTATTPVRTTGRTAERLHVLQQVHPPPTAGATPWMTVLGRAPVVSGRRPGAMGVRFESGQISRKHARFDWSPRFDCYTVTDLDSRNGTFVNGARVTEARLTSNSRIRVGDHLLLYTTFSFPRGAQPDRLDPTVSLARTFAELMADRAAPMDLPVLVIGPTGAGKERMARRIHDASGRRGQYVTVNCATLDKSLAASQLFGHGKGAFTSAAGDRAGLFVTADRGTLFLDEIGELPLDVQPQLLRVLQEGRLTPVGKDRERTVDVRIVAATHRDLEAMVAEGTFRADLYARLRGVQLDLPGLADRRAEILPIFRTLLGDRPISVEAAEALLAFDWPTNVRGLQSVVNHLRLTGGADMLEASDLPTWVQPATSPATPSRKRKGRPTYDDLHALLREHRGNVTHVGKALGVARQQVHRWADQCGLVIKDFRP